jgi:ABC-type glycerol-3-phosphate transport system permease component
MDTSRNEKYVATVVALVSTVTFLFPIYWMIVTSIKPMNELFVSPPTFFPHEPTFLAYKENLIDNQSILGYIGNSFIIGMGTMLVALLLAAPVAYALARLDVKGKALVMILLLTSHSTVSSRSSLAIRPTPCLLLLWFFAPIFFPFLLGSRMRQRSTDAINSLYFGGFFCL